MKSLLVLALFAVAASVSADNAQCEADVKKCSDAYTNAASNIPAADTDKKCEALMLEYTCLRASDKVCSGGDRTALEQELNNVVVPTLINDCPGQMCDVDIAGCTEQWTNNATRDNQDKKKSCNDANYYEACLNGIQLGCLEDQQTKIRGMLDKLRATIRKDCRGVDCGAQLNQCVGAWKDLLKLPQQQDLAFTCQADQGLRICLEGIEIDCTTQEKAALDKELKDVKDQLDKNCKGQSCTPNIIECTIAWNQSVSVPGVAQDVTKLCKVDQTFDACLKGVQDYCDPDEMKEIQTAQTTLATDLKAHCSGAASIDSLKMLMFFAASTLLLKFFS